MTVEGGARSESFRVVRSNANIYPFIVYAGRDKPVRHDSARVDLYDDGAYSATYWYDRMYEINGASIQQTTGSYIAEGDTYVFDPGMPQVVLGVANADTLRISSVYEWGYGLSGEIVMTNVQ
ncbi:MAG: hypothetical protein Rubg2KO_25130 [Rubricoccaceae bacterium]